MLLKFKVKKDKLNKKKLLVVNLIITHLKLSKFYSCKPNLLFIENVPSNQQPTSMDMSSPILYNSQTPSSLRTPGARTPPSSRGVTTPVRLCLYIYCSYYYWWYLKFTAVV